MSSAFPHDYLVLSTTYPKFAIACHRGPSAAGGMAPLVTSTLDKNTTLEKGTQIGLFHVCKHTIVIVNDIQEESVDTVSICSVQKHLCLGRKFRNYLKSTNPFDLDQNLVSLLLPHVETVALPGDILGRTDMIKHQIKLKL